MSQNNDFMQSVDDLQKAIDKDEEKVYSKTAIQQYRNPHNFGCISHPDATAQVKGPCGDSMRIDLRFEGDIITKARFWTDGCGASLACGNMLTTLALNKPLDVVANISSEEVLNALDGLPPDHSHCATLAVTTMRKAIAHKRERG